MQSIAKRRADYFTPDIPPTDPESLPTWISNQMKNLSESVHNVNSMHLNKTSHWPEGYKPTEGDIVWADEGLIGDEGIYIYKDGEWVPFQTGASSATTPIGGIIMWRGSTAPGGWAICDGSNAPNGMSTPDLRNRFVLGFGTNGIDVTGGATVSSWTSLTTAQIPSHDHTIAHQHNISSHTHNISNHTHTQSGTFDSNETGDHAHGHSTGNAGAHNHGVTQVLTGRTSHSTGTLNNRDFADPPVNFNAEPNHTHSISTDGNHKHTISGNTGGSSASSSGNKGNGEAHNHEAEPPFYTLAYIMRYE